MRKPRQRLYIWIAFTLVSVCPVYVAAIFGSDSGFGDLFLYQDWARIGLHLGIWPVLDNPWVYPLGALAPIALLSHLGSRGAFALAWLGLIVFFNAVALIVIRRKLPNGDAACWWWLGFLVLLGPVALSRIDAVAAAAATIALVLIQTRPILASALITYAGWVKVVHFAWLVPVFILTRRRIRTVFVPWFLVSTAIVGLGLLLGSGSRIYSFLTAQSDRGLQAESVIATPLSIARMWNGSSRLMNNTALNTYEYVGVAAQRLAHAADVLIIFAVLAVSVLVLIASQKTGHDTIEILALGTLAMTLTLIAFNKVGSPQFTLWLAAPLVLSFAISSPLLSWRTPQRIALAVAGLTQMVYPLFYGSYIHDAPPMIVIGAVRNVLIVALLIWAVHALIQMIRSTPKAKSAQDAQP